MKSALTIKAGASALATIKSEGLQPSLFSTFFGASGGPKWLSLSRIDQVLAAEFLPKCDKLSLMGTSIGSWRMAAHAHPAALTMLKRFEDNYVNAWSTDSWNDPENMENDMISGLKEIFTGDGASAATTNKNVELNIIADRCRGILASENKAALIAGMGTVWLANRFDRRNLRHFYERVQFTTAPDLLPTIRLNQLPTTYAKLDDSNLFKVIAASSSIPMVMHAVKEINHCKPGSYRDGGITDYHFDFDFKGPEGLTLFAHFYDSIVPGWLDKGNKLRKPSKQGLDKMLFVSPSREWISSLRLKKIPDRTDFTKMTGIERQRYWQEFIEESQRLADELYTLITSESPEQLIQPM